MQIVLSEANIVKKEVRCTHIHVPGTVDAAFVRSNRSIMSRVLQIVIFA